MNLVLLLVFSSIVFKVILSDEVPKCCSAHEILSKNGSTFNCVPDLTRRLQINTNNTNHLETNPRNICYDVFEDNFVGLKDNTVETVTGRFFPKCCPLNTVYNTKLHSCVEKIVSNNNFINETFIKVGLKNCKIVADFDLEKDADFEYKLLDSSKKIRRTSLQDYSSFCVDKTESDSFVIRECQDGFDSCDNFRCIKKCCPDGQSFVNGPKCQDTYEHGINLTVLSKTVNNLEGNFAIVHNRTCSNIYLMREGKHNVTIHDNGSFTEWHSTGFRTENVADPISYCIEHTQKKNMNGYYMFHCFPEKPTALTKFEYRLWPFIMSCVFLVLTVVVYIIIKEWRKMFGKILVSYCIASFFVYVILTLGQLYTEPTSTDCQLRAFFLIFFAIAQFSWANVMSFEIWCTFGTTKIYLGTNYREAELRKFIFYSIYAWGTPLILTLITLLFSEWKVLPFAIQPYIGNVKCFFDVKQGNYAKFLFLNIPLLIIQIINMIFFVKTIIYCVKVRNEINKINDGRITHSKKKYNHDRERYNWLFLILKLSIVMGMSYIFEVVTAFFNMSELGTVPKYIEIVFDSFNALQGVLIFIIFICKKKILLNLAQKCTIFGIHYSPNTSSVRTHSSLTLNGVAMTTLGSQNNNQKLV
ncbi:G-protein coupled receptor Mth2-like isoform X1 [Diabrotica undecimpunctata]|uniref:G-protein coupled receptor Mth2-like isoform X1 n=1 Tax=Diabrotica undecimpunctata TaxID=50387 RepID=UPI003B63F81F